MTLRDRAAMLSGHASGQQISAYVDGQTAGAVHDWVSQHLESCSRCATAAAREAWLKSRVSGLGSVTAVPDRFAALSQLEACRVASSSGSRRGTVAVAGAGALGVAVLGMVGYVAPSVGPAQLSSMTTTTVAEVSQTVGQTLDSATKWLRGSAH